MKYAAIPHTKAARAKVTRVLREYRHRRLYTPSGRRVTTKRQAVAIALSEARHMGNPQVCAVKYAHGLVNKWCDRQRGHAGPHSGSVSPRAARRRWKPKRYRRNPEGHGHGKLLAFGLIGLGLLLYLRQSQTVTQPIPQQPGGILGPISGVLGNLGSSSWFQNLWVTAPSATAGEWQGTWTDTQATPILGSEIQGP